MSTDYFLVKVLVTSHFCTVKVNIFVTSVDEVFPWEEEKKEWGPDLEGRGRELVDTEQFRGWRRDSLSLERLVGGVHVTKSMRSQILIPEWVFLSKVPYQSDRPRPPRGSSLPFRCYSEEDSGLRDYVRDG